MSQEKINKYLKHIVSGILLWIIFYKLWLIRIPATHECFYLVGDVLYQIALSIIASYIFYIFNVYIPERKKEEERKKKASLLIKYYIDDINNFANSIRYEVVHWGYDKTQGNDPDFESCLSNIIILSFDKINKDTHYSETIEYWRGLFDKVRSNLIIKNESLSTHLIDDLKKETIDKLLDLPSNCTINNIYQLSDYPLSNLASNFNEFFNAIEEVENDLKHYLDKKQND